MNVIALDPSISSTGFAVFIDDELVNYGALKTVKDGDNYFERVFDICNELNCELEIYENYAFDLVIEDQYLGGNPKVYSELVGVKTSLVMSLFNNDNIQVLDIKLFSPSRWRKLLGISNARGIDKKKDSVDSANNYDKDLGLTYVKKNSKLNEDDIADAINIGRAYYNYKKDGEIEK